MNVVKSLIAAGALRMPRFELTGTVRSLFYRAYRRLARFTYWYERRFTGMGRLVVASALTFGIFGVDTEQSTAYQAFTYLVALLALAVAGSAWFRASVRFERELPRYATAGEPLEYRVRITNTGKRVERGLTVFEDIAFEWPTKAEFRVAREYGARRNRIDQMMGYYAWNAMLAERRNARIAPVDVPAVSAGDSVSVTLTLTAAKRGVVRLAGTSIARTDPLSLARAFSRISAPQSLLVLPKRYALPPITLPGQRRYQPGGVALAASAGDSEEFFGLRDYQPGDPLQRVHWKSFARVGYPIVKEFQHEFFERHALALDTAFCATGEAAFEEAVCVAASFVYTLDTQECLLDLLFAGDEVHRYTSGRGLLRAEHLLEVLAGVRMRADTDTTRLQNAILECTGEIASCILVLAGWDEARRGLVDALRRGGLNVLALAVVPEDTVIEPSAGVWPLRLGRVQADLLSRRVA